MRNVSSRAAVLILLCLTTLCTTPGCKREPEGTSENLQADYDRVVKERDDLKADFEKRKAEIEGVWQQRVSDKDQKIAELTSDDANLRQRLLVADAATEDVPLTDAARSRSILWLHGIYVLMIAICIVLMAVILWVHLNLRERMRVHLLQQSRFVPKYEVPNVE